MCRGNAKQFKVKVEEGVEVGVEVGIEVGVEVGEGLELMALID